MSSAARQLGREGVDRAMLKCRLYFDCHEAVVLSWRRAAADAVGMHLE